MNYSRFVALGRPAWERFAARLDEAQRRKSELSHQQVEDLAFDYRRILHDHALARARYPGTDAAKRLRRLALEGTRALVHERAATRTGPVRFFLHVFPAVFRRHLPTMAFSLALFTGLVLFGLTVSALHPAYGLLFVGQDAVEGLADGRLWTESLTTSIPPQVSSSFIATNNMSVALTGWAGGAAAGLGSLYVIVLNGLMLGAVFGLTAHYSLAGALFEFVAAHGPLEITLILVTAAGGLVMGRGMVAAGDRPRGEKMAEAARDALVLLGGCLPWFVLLGIVEGFVSPAPEFPLIFKVAVGILLEAAFLTLALNPFTRSESLG